MPPALRCWREETATGSLQPPCVQLTLHEIAMKIASKYLANARHQTSVRPGFIGEMTRPNTNSGVSRQKLARPRAPRMFAGLSLFEILERAKGFEPSTPTLARSCSTTELHPHPRDWRRSLTGNAQSYAKCGPRMQQPARDLPIGRIARYREVLPVNQPETSCECPPGSSVAASGNPAGRLAVMLRGDSSHLPNEPRSVPVSLSRRPITIFHT